MEPTSPSIEFDSSPLARLPSRIADSHKGDYGRALLLGGSRGMAGAISLAGIAALRGGAGLVRLAVPQAIEDVVAAHEPSYMTVGLPADELGRLGDGARRTVLKLASEATVVACGPGLGRSTAVTEVILELYAHLPQPMVFDADALNALAALGEDRPQPGGPRVLTPHPAEFARLLGMETAAVLADRDQLAVSAAQRWGVTLLVKGHRTIVTDGRRAALNTNGNPGMATGGSGDVLTGLVTALLCQGLPPYEAARLGAHLHGLAGDLAAAELGQVSLIASDLCRYLPKAFQAL